MVYKIIVDPAAIIDKTLFCGRWKKYDCGYLCIAHQPGPQNLEWTIWNQKINIKNTLQLKKLIYDLQILVSRVFQPDKK